MNQRPAHVIEKFKQFYSEDIGVSTITVFELQYAVAKSARRQDNQQRLNDFLAPFEILDYDETAARLCGDMRFLLEKRGRPIGPFNLMIAAHALSQRLVLVTNNAKNCACRKPEN
jgi:tRNA(fMet)-specific endonuclease VapC